MTTLPEAKIDYEVKKRLKKIGDIEFSKPKHNWLVKGNKNVIYVIDKFDSAIILSEILKLKKGVNKMSEEEQQEDLMDEEKEESKEEQKEETE